MLKSCILELPYNNSDIVMKIFLPFHRDGLHHLHKKMKNFDLNSLDGSLDNVEVQVTVPKFKIHFSLNMKDSLQKVGIMIEWLANFGRILCVLV